MHACRYDTEEEKKALLPVLRDLSRQEYLKKREQTKLVSRRTSARAGLAVFPGGREQGRGATAKGRGGGGTLTGCDVCAWALVRRTS